MLLKSWLGVHILGKVYNGSWGVSDSALRQKNWTKQFLPLPFYRSCDLCNSFGFANREVSESNQPFSKGSVCPFLSSEIPRSRTILFQVEYTHQANIVKVKQMCSFSSMARAILLVQKKAQNSLVLENSKLYGKKKLQRIIIFFKKTYTILCNHYLWDNKLWQGRVLLWFLSLRHGLQCTQWMAKFLRHKEVSNWSKKLGNSSSVSCLFFNELSISSSIRLNFFRGQTGPGHLEYVFVLCFLLVDWAIAKLMHSSCAFFFFVADCKDSC